MLLQRYIANKPFLARSKFRSSFNLDEKDISYVNKVGLDKIKEHTIEFITKRLAPAFPIRDGKQTPYSGHPVFKAQHAIGCCCRKCLQKWYGIQKGIQLNEEHINQISEMIIEWIKEKIKVVYPLGITNSATIRPIINPPAPISAGTIQSKLKLPETSVNVT